MPPQKCQSGKRMWPFSFSGMSLETANWLSDIANIVAVSCLVGGVLAAFIIFRTSSVKERHWEKDRQEARLKISILETSAAEANERAKMLESGIADANARALEAQLALEKFKAPRGLTPDQQRSIIEKIKSLSGQEFQGAIASGTADGRLFWNAIHKTLTDAGWIFVSPSTGYGEPPAAVPIAPSAGITIFAPGENTSTYAAGMTLAKALADEGFDVTISSGVFGDNSKRQTMIVIEIGPKTK